MIWVLGRILPDDGLSISVVDRTFEHGLGLFETLRTWGGRAPLLVRHLERLRRSAESLGLRLDASALPGAEDVARLVQSEGGRDVSLRITLSGGPDENTPGTLWMRSRPLPPPIQAPGAKVRATWIVPESDELARFKSLNYWWRRILFERAKADGFDEDLGRDQEGALLEGSRSNIFAVLGGRLWTPGLRHPDGTDRPMLPGVMRSVVLERASLLGVEVIEDDRGSVEMLERADEVFLTNGGRGIVPVARFGPHRVDEPGRVRHYDAPGPVTSRLKAHLDTWLRSEDAR